MFILVASAVISKTYINAQFRAIFMRERESKVEIRQLSQIVNLRVFFTKKAHK